MKQKRLGWIDICKAIAIFFMVLGHVGGLTKFVNCFIHCFHMPLFFILSGYCFNFKKYNVISEFIKKRFKTLIIPYLVFGALLFFIWDGCLYILHRQSEMKSVLSLLKSLLYVNTTASTFGVVQWFLTCLFFVEVLFIIICKLSKNHYIKISVITIIMSLFTYAFSILCNFRLPLAVDTAMMAIVFYAIGYIMKEKMVLEKYNFNKLIPNIIIILVTIVLAFVCIPLININGEVNMRTLHFGNYILFLFNALVYSSIVIIVSAIFDKWINVKPINNFFQWIGRNTLVVLLLNSTLIRIYLVAADKIKYVKMIPNYIIALIVIILCVIISEIINKYFPFLLGKRSKKHE